MKIVRITAKILHLPLQYPLLEPSVSKDNVFVEIETDEGLVGYALSGCILSRQVRDLINQNVDGLLEGMDPILTEQVRGRMLSKLAGKRPFGVWAEAMSLIDVALWDIKGKFFDQPVWKLLGGSQNPVPAYITFGLPRYDKEQLVEAARMLVQQGQDKLKMVVARSGYSEESDSIRGRGTDGDVREDAERVRAVREAVGDDVELMVDANYMFNLNQAIRLAKLIEPYNLTWFEDAVYGSDPRLMSQLRMNCTIPIAAGSTGTEHIQRARELLIHNAVDILQPNVRDIGGFTEAIKAAGMAQAFNVPIAQGGNWPHMNMHLHAGVPNGGRVEFHLGGWKLAATVFKDAVEPVDGWVTVPDTPGLGLEPRDGVVREYEVINE